MTLIESIPAEQARMAGGAPLSRCLLHGDIADGIATAIVAREIAGNRVFAVLFLVDLYCLGIKDIIFQDTSTEEFELLTLLMHMEAPVTPAEPAYVRKLLRDAAVWASSIGFEPHRDFAAAEEIFGDVDANSSNATFVFGQDGKPLYISGPTETPAQIRKRLAHLHDRRSVFPRRGPSCEMSGVVAT